MKTMKRWLTVTLDHLVAVILTGCVGGVSVTST